MAVVPLAQRLADIESQGTCLTRRIERMQSDYDFLIDSLITRPVADMMAQKRLLDQWHEEIEQMKIDLELLRSEWLRLDIIMNSKAIKNKESYENKERTKTGAKY